MLVISAVVLLCPRAHAWRSTLYPTNWQPPTVTSVNFETDKVIEDFSYAGYRNGETNLPQIAGPIFNVTQPPFNADASGAVDATAAIQSAVNAAQSAGGGVVFLPAGNFSVSPQGANSYALQITAGNVVLRGTGVGSTFLLNTSTNMRSKSIILFSGPSNAGFYSSGAGSTTITQDLLGPTRLIPVASTNGFAVGQWVVVRADCTDAWITEHNEPDWLGYGSTLRGVAYFRQITAVTTSSLTINAPTRYYLKTRDNARVVRLSAGPLLNCGLEDFSIGNREHTGTGWGEEDYSTAGTAAYDVHDSFAVRMIRVRDSWIRNLASFQPAGNTLGSHLLSNGILLNESSQVTLTNCNLQRTQYGGGGGNGYMYRLQNANDCLLMQCQSTFTRHGFVLSHMGCSGNVFHVCTDKDSGRQVGNTGLQSTAGANSDHHMHFSHANLVDDCTGDGSGWEARYRPYGSVPLHNLTAAHSVYWNPLGQGSGPSYVVQTEQSRYGYVIGTRGPRNGVSFSTYGGTKCDPVDHAEGIGLGTTLEPFSLYQDQLSRRLNRPQVSIPAVVVLGFPTNSLQLQPAVQLGNQTANPNQYSATWRVVAATGRVVFSATNIANPVITFGSRGTNELEVIITAEGQQASARVTVILACNDATQSESLVAVADTFVRDGSFASDNYGSDTTLLIKKNNTAGFTRRAFLRFDLNARTLTGFDRAFVELRSPTPPLAGTAPTLGLYFVTNDTWIETSMNWNTQPALGSVVASWPMSTTGLDRTEVTAPALSAAAGDGLLSLGLLVIDPVSDTVYSFHSREAGGALQPRLILEADEGLPYADWIAGYSNVPQPARAPDRNADGDRFMNAEEFLFARNPTQIDTDPAVTASTSADRIVLTYPQRKLLPCGFNYVIETTSSLAAPDWQLAAGVEFEFGQDLGAAWLMRASIPATLAAQRFYRFAITISP